MMNEQDYLDKLQATLDSAEIPVSATELIEGLISAFVIVPRAVVARATGGTPAEEDFLSDLLFPDFLTDRMTVTFK